jgi:hypothetical protein
MKYVSLSRAAIGLFAFALPVAVFAQSAAPGPGTAPAISAPQASVSLSKSDDAKLEAHIKTLHDELQITPAEETDWASFAGVMRVNATNMHEAFDARARVTSMSAEQNMQSYANLAQMHADGMEKLAAAFSTLYESFPAAQKTVADKLFQQQAVMHDVKH